MLKHEKNKLIIGYVVGFLIFVITIPSLIYLVSRIEYDFFKIPVIGSIVYRLILVGILFIIGMTFVVWSNIDLLRIGKGGPTDVFNVKISPRSKKLVVTGPYRYTRNPMVLGINSIYVAIAIFINSLGSLIFCLLFLFVIIIYLKMTEEKRLLKDFGDEYSDYKKRVSMIVPFRKKEKDN